MNEFFTAILQNVVLMSALTAWLIAQILKVIINFITQSEMDIERLFGAGGMPSSHTALVVALASSVAFHDGAESTFFALAFVLASIVMYDAAGVRNAAGKQAKVINKLVRQMRAEHTVDIRLKELLGHSPLEVLAGALLGFAIAYLFKNL
ncbi:MAG: divergent PAP2 family protein [Pelosinus sp.]|nr:divergent PAP2 family protein [Pelosinus sp.]